MNWRDNFAVPEKLHKDILFYSQYQGTDKAPFPTSGEAKALISSVLVLAREINDLCTICDEILVVSDGRLLETVHKTSQRTGDLWREVGICLNHKRKISREDIEGFASEVPSEVLDAFFQYKKILAWIERVEGFVNPRKKEQRELDTIVGKFEAQKDNLFNRVEGLCVIMLKNRLTIEMRSSLLSHFESNGISVLPELDIEKMYIRLCDDFYRRFELRLDEILQENPSLIRGN